MIVGAREFFVACRVGQVKICFAEITAGEQGGAQPGILFHGKTVPGRQRKNEDIGVEKLHADVSGASLVQRR